MKLIVIAAAIALLPLSVAFGQAQVEKPAASPADEAKPAPQKGVNLVQGPGQSAVKEDARHCLELSTNNEIIKCAAPYLPAKRQ
ncbi:MAG TPA: hypothetical protein VFR39_03540 [Burkholderiales bacterium]|nr:hypothetical protein [Burkholderiales bacterium]